MQLHTKRTAKELGHDEHASPTSKRIPILFQPAKHSPSPNAYTYFFNCGTKNRSGLSESPRVTGPARCLGSSLAGSRKPCVVGPLCCRGSSFEGSLLPSSITILSRNPCTAVSYTIRGSSTLTSRSLRPRIESTEKKIDSPEKFHVR